jgi:hypothetical protein
MPPKKLPVPTRIISLIILFDIQSHHKGIGKCERLPADVAEGIGLPHTLPFHDWLGTFPSELSYRRCSIRDAPENGDAT